MPARNTRSGGAVVLTGVLLVQTAGGGAHAAQLAADPVGGPALDA